MPAEGTDNSSSHARLLGEEEPAPFIIRNPDSTAPVLLVCDHASRRFPQSLASLGLDPLARQCHLALDIGAAALTEKIAVSLGVTAVLCQYSRLVIDCNRQLMDPGAFMEFGDGVVIPGNRNLGEDDKNRRADEIYKPYHDAIDGQIVRLRQAGVEPVFIAIHSFTPVMNGQPRDWEMGVLWDRDPVTARIFVHDLREAGFVVGDNEPYSGKAPQDYTIDHHAEPVGLPHVGIEIRQDLIHLDDGVKRIAEILQEVIKSVPARITPTDIASQDHR